MSSLKHPLEGAPRGAPFFLRARFLGAAAACLLAAVSWNLLGRTSSRSESVTVSLPRPEVAKVLAFGFDAFGADLYWVGGLNYFATPKYDRSCWWQLKDYLAVSIALAPDFQSSYRFAGSAIPCRTRAGWQLVDESIALLEKGVERSSENWFLALLLANNYTLKNDYRGAANVLSKAALVPGAPPYFAGLATRFMATSGDLSAATSMAEELLRGTDNEGARESLERRVSELRLIRDLERMGAAIAAFRNTAGRPPNKLEDLVSAGLLDRVPDPPETGRWRYDPATGELDSDRPLPHVTIYQEQAP